MRKRLLSHILCLTFCAVLHPFLSSSRATKLLIVDCDELCLLLIIQPFGNGKMRHEACGMRSHPRPDNGACAFVTMFTQIFKDNPTISKGLLCNFSSHFIVAARKNTKKIKKNVQEIKWIGKISKCKMSILSCKRHSH